ncbi:MAG: hypothetical protein ACREPM_13360 [Gemmatimonadaceae bacterium]
MNMSDTTKKPEQPAVAPTSAEKITDLPDKPVTDREADAVKAGRYKLDPPIG